jgi:hypothetical protein
LILGLILATFSGLGFALYGFNIVTFGYPGMDARLQYLKWLDVISSTLIIGGMISFSMKTKYAFVLLFVAGILATWIQIELNAWIVLVNVLIFKVNDVIGYMAWSGNSTKKNRPTNVGAVQGIAP